MQAFRGHFHDAFVAGCRHAAGLFDDVAHRIGCIEQAQFAGISTRRSQPHMASQKPSGADNRVVFGKRQQILVASKQVVGLASLQGSQ